MLILAGLWFLIGLGLVPASWYLAYTFILRFIDNRDPHSFAALISLVAPLLFVIPVVLLWGWLGKALNVSS